MKRVILFAACLLAAVPALAQEGLSFGSVANEYHENPNVFVKCEVLGLGFSYPHVIAVQVLRVTCTAWGVRVGASLAEEYGFFNGGVGLPIHVGYTLVSRSQRVLFFHNMYPEVYAEISTAFWKFAVLDFMPFVRGSLYAGIEGFGLGAGLEAGVMSLGWDDNGPESGGSFRRRTSPYVALRVKLLAFSFGF